MGKKRAREAEEEEVEHQVHKKVKIQKENNKKEKKKRDERIKQEIGQEIGDEVRVGGVVVSIGSVRFASLPRVIDDQNVFHMDIFVTQAVFRPIPGQTYEARVTHIADDFISALILEAIAINMPIDDKLHEKLKGITLELDDIIEVKHNTITIKRGICQLKGKFVRILRKGVPKTELIGDPSDSTQPEVKVKNKRKTFASDEEE
ncbi:hypothetical protein ANCCEY_15178 [Ancylostoma ceylanicum]|uniref:Uncharacterized protein n=1 Tax=Ancylostoma ceylanicum TaxID=53326 RepID=A0A0D6LDD0_9BILA|nr:hypothetical protein ANCCEY_15178 [Ancylostoma ceylanicum]